MDHDIQQMYAAQIGMTFIHDFMTIGLAIPIVLYIVARWRMYRENLPPDPYLGFKVALSLFRIIAYQLCLGAAFLLVYAMITDLPDSVQSSLGRTGMGLLLPGLIVWVAHAAAIMKTNTEEIPHVARMFSGLALIQTGLVGFMALVFACVLLFQKGSSGEAGRAAWSAVMVYTTAWAVQGLLFARGLERGRPAPEIAQMPPR